MAGPDLYRAFRALPPHERDIVLAWSEALGVEVEDCPPLQAIVEAVAVARLADTLEGSEDARFREAAHRVGVGGADSLLRKVRYWRARSGKKFSDEGQGKVEVQGAR
jgi:hypothetical protein